MKEELKIFSETPVLRIFESAFIGGGSYIVADCEHCGRVYFTDGKGDFEEGQYENLVKQSVEEPEKYIQSDWDCIDYAHIGGKQLVLECKCNAGKKYQDFLLHHATQIATFFEAYAKQKQVDADGWKDISENANKIK